MKDKWTQKWDEVSAQHRRELDTLDRMEEEHYHKKRAFEERYNRLEEYRQQLQSSIENHYEETMYVLREHSANPNIEEAQQNLNQLTEMAISTSQEKFQTQYHKLISEEDEFEHNYRREHRKQEDKVEELRQELIRIDIAEREEKGLR